MSNQIKTKKVYLASGFFNQKQIDQVDRLEALLDSYSWIDLASPRRIFVCPPDADESVQKSTFEGNIKHLKEADFVIGNTQDKDIGSIFELGASYAFSVPIIYFCEGLPPKAKFNLMLARSGIKVCTSLEQLEDYLDRVTINNGELIYEPYNDLIE